MTSLTRMPATSTSTASILRVCLLALLLLGMAGAGTELWLTQHTEDAWQWAPLVLIAAATFTLVCDWMLLGMRRQRVASLRALQSVMLLFIASGFAGIALHTQAKMEFKQESDPTLKGWNLLVGSLESKSPPPLAPGVMIHLGLIGLAYAYRHPGLRREDLPPERENGPG